MLRTGMRVPAVEHRAHHALSVVHVSGVANRAPMRRLSALTNRLRAVAASDAWNVVKAVGPRPSIPMQAQLMDPVEAVHAKSRAVLLLPDDLLSEAPPVELLAVLEEKSHRPEAPQTRGVQQGEPPLAGVIPSQSG